MKSLSERASVIAVKTSVLIHREGAENLRFKGEEGITHLDSEPHIGCYFPNIYGRLGRKNKEKTKKRGMKRREMQHFDVAELFAFTHAAEFIVPTLPSLARFFGIKAEEDDPSMPKKIMMEIFAEINAKKKIIKKSCTPWQTQIGSGHPIF